MCHQSPEKARDKATEILDFIKETGTELLVLCCDGTRVNTGPHAGINRIIESSWASYVNKLSVVSLQMNSQ